MYMTISPEHPLITTSLKQYFIYMISSGWNLLIYISIVVLMFIIIKFLDAYKKQIYKYRWFLAIALLLTLTMLKINGSSIGCFMPQLAVDADKELLIGRNRPVRSDEWAVFTPMTISQFFNHSGILQYFGETFRACKTDMFLEYGQPVWDIAVLFRPFHWGYLFLGLERGLSFFWCGRIIFLFMVSFEFCMLISKKNKFLSLAYAFLITFSPIVSWWVAINGLVEMLVFGQLAIIIINHYLRSESFLIKCLLALALAFCAEAYLLTFYPAWQIPLAYVFLALLIWLIIENFDSIPFSLKKDIPAIAIFILVLAVATIYIFTKSQDTILAIMNTSYPGKRISTGGDYSLRDYFGYASNLFFPVAASTNACEFAKFFDFFPLGLIFTAMALIKDKKRDKLLLALVCVFFILSIYCLVGFPTMISKLTLLSFTPTNRAYIAIGFINILLLVRSISVLSKKHSRFERISFAIISALVVSIISRQFIPGYISSFKQILILIVLLLSFICVASKNYKKFALICIAITLISGFMVNPVRSGISNSYDNKVVSTIREVSQKDKDAKWITQGIGLPAINIPTLAGAPSINSTNVYPNIELWSKLDPEGKYYDAYNRYAHIAVILTEEETRFELPFADQLFLYLNPKDIDKLDVKYIFSTDTLEVFNRDNVEFALDTSIVGTDYKIYRVNLK